MKKIIKIILCALVLFSCIFVALNWNKIVFLMDAFTNKYTEEDIQNLENESYGVLKGVAEDAFEFEMNELGEDEKKALEEGRITEEDARQIVLGKKEFVDGNVVDKGKSETTSKAVDKSAEIISEIYVLEATYTGKLKSIEHNMLVSYNQLPVEEKTTNNKYRLANNAINEGLALEKECDAKLEALLVKLEKNLVECGKDTSVIAEIRKTYKNKKSAMQSYYFRKYS